MLDIASINAIAGILAAIGVLVGVVFAVLEVRNLVKTRQTELLMGFYSVRGKEWWESWEKVRDREAVDYNDYKKKHGFVEVNQIGSFYEGVGVLLKRKLIDEGLVQDFFGSDVKTIWERFRFLIEEGRKKLNRPDLYSPFEYLYNEMQKGKQTLQTQQ